MSHDELITTLRQSPVVAAVRAQEGLAQALLSPVRVVFILGGDSFGLPDAVARVREAGKLAFVHADLVEGVSRDTAGIRWIARAAAPTGVLSTRSALLKAAADEGLHTVLRMFMVDSSSVETGVRMVKSASPDLVEIMPGLVTRVIPLLRQRIAPPVIAGGMLALQRDVELALEAGALAASTSAQALWG